MATKPLTAPRLWGTNAFYTTGPFNGQPGKVDPGVGVAAEGHRPGANFPTPAEFENYQQNRTTDWVTNWLRLGTSSPDPDAHVVETDATGRAGLHGLDVICTADEVAVNITGVNTLAPTVLATCTTGATVYQADIGNSTGTGFAGSVASNAGTVFNANLFNSPSGAAGLRVVADNTSGAYCVDLTNAGIGRALRITNTGFSNEAMFIDSLLAPNATGLNVRVGPNAPNAITALSGTTLGNAIRATLANTSGFAVHASTPGASITTARAVYAQAFGAATAIEASGVGSPGANNAALLVKMQNGVLSGSELAFAGRTGDSSTTVGGRVNYNLTTGTITQSDPAGSQRDMLTSRGNFISEADADKTILVAGVYATVCTLNLQGMNAPRRAALRIVLRFDCEVRSIGGAANTFDVRITDNTAPANVKTRQGIGAGATAGFLLGVATASWQRSVVLVASYTIPVAGDRIFVVEVRSATGQPIEVRDASLIPAMPALV